jgi:uncharacterized Zn finger protein
MLFNTFSKSSFFFIAVLFICTSIFAQDNEKAEQAVMKYMQTRYADSDYTPHRFSNTFVHPHASVIGEKMGTDEKVAFSVIHTLTVNGNKIESEYFHLDSSFQVIGHLSEQEMLEVFMEAFYSRPEIKQILSEFNVDTVFFSIETKPKE